MLLQFGNYIGPALDDESDDGLDHEGDEGDEGADDDEAGWDQAHGLDRQHDDTAADEYEHKQPSDDTRMISAAGTHTGRQAAAGTEALCLQSIC